MSRLFSNSTAIRDEDDTDDLGPQAITSLSSTSGSGDESDSSGASLIINSVSMTDIFSSSVKYCLFLS